MPRGGYCLGLCLRLRAYASQRSSRPRKRGPFNSDEIFLVAYPHDSLISLPAKQGLARARANSTLPRRREKPANTFLLLSSGSTLLPRHSERTEGQRLERHRAARKSRSFAIIRRNRLRGGIAGAARNAGFRVRNCASFARVLRIPSSFPSSLPPRGCSLQPSGELAPAGTRS